MNKASLAKKTDKNVYSALFGEISNINLSVDKDVRQVVAPTNKQGLNTQLALQTNQSLNCESILSKFGVTIIPEDDDEIGLDVVPRLAKQIEKEDGLVRANEYIKRRSFSKQKLRKLKKAKFKFRSYNSYGRENISIKESPS